MARVTCTFPWASGLVLVWEPVSPTVKGAAGTVPVPVDGIVVGVVVAPPGRVPEVAPAFLRASWASSAA